jgi:hypothetical protein
MAVESGYMAVESGHMVVESGIWRLNLVILCTKDSGHLSADRWRTHSSRTNNEDIYLINLQAIISWTAWLEISAFLYTLAYCKHSQYFPYSRSVWVQM